jgi:hypothetical protein
MNNWKVQQDSKIHVYENKLRKVRPRVDDVDDVDAVVQDRG